MLTSPVAEHHPRKLEPEPAEPGARGCAMLRAIIDEEKLRVIAKQYGIDLIVLFGSYAKGRARADSDVDLGVWFEHPKNRRGNNRYEHERALHRALRRAMTLESKLQLVFLNRCDSLLMRQIVVSGRPVFTRNGATWPLFCSYANRRYYDDEKYRKRIAQFLRRRYGESRSA